MAAVRIYTTPTCPYCHAALGLLRAKGIAFEQIDVSRDPAMRRRLVELTGRTTVPQIFIREHHVGGCDDLFDLHHSGKLDEFFKQ